MNMFKLKKSDLIYFSLIVYLYVLLFGGWFLKVIGLPTNLTLIIVKAIDFFPILYWIILNPVFLLTFKTSSFKSLKFWLLWLVVLVLLLLTSWFHQRQAISLSLVQWGALVRYIPLACIVLMIQKHKDYWSHFLYHLRLILTILLILFGAILIGGEGVMYFFLPAMAENATGLRESLLGNYSVIFANTIDYAFLMTLLYTFFVNNAKLNNFKRVIFTLLLLYPIFRTGSAISVIVFLLIAWISLTRNVLKVRYFFIGICVLVLTYLGYQYRTEVKEVIEVAQLSRLGMLLQTLPDFLKEMNWDTFWGVGCDGYVVLDKVNSYDEPVLMLLYANPGDISMFGDVYWVALIVYHGLIGFLLIVILYYLVYRSVAVVKYADSDFYYKSIVNCLFMAIFIFGFLNQILVVKTFCSVFWLLMGFIYSKRYNYAYFASK